MINIPIWLFILSLFTVASVSCTFGYILCALFVAGKQADSHLGKAGYNE